MFRFRTQEPRGLLSLAQGGAQSPIFFAFEVFDGRLYFVYDFGSVTHRKPLFDRRVDNGEWHDVRTVGPQRSHPILILIPNNLNL